MSERQSGSYGLRRAAAPKKIDSDFEYYYTKTRSAPETPLRTIKEEKVENLSNTIVSLSRETEQLSDVRQDQMPSAILHIHTERKFSDSPSKRPRGRPRKHPTSEENNSSLPDVALLDEDYVHLKPKRGRQAREEVVEECGVVDSVMESLEQGLGQDLMVEGMIPQAETHVVISASVSEEGKKLRLEELRRVRDILEVEQAVISLPPQDHEKENQPHVIEEVMLTEEAPEEIVLQLVGSESIQSFETNMEVALDSGFASVKPRRKYRRFKTTNDTLRQLKDFPAEEKIECSECHKLLKPSSFRQHLRTHTGIKPFGCEVCDARFTRKGDVERHVRIVHNKQKPFQCHRCPRSFGDKKNLRWHLMNHDKKLFYVCETCGFKFGKKEYYENHVRFIHPMADDERFEVEDEDLDEELEDEVEEEEDYDGMPESILSATMEVEDNVEDDGNLNFHSYTAGGYVIKKTGNTISVLDPTESEDQLGECVEMTEAQLQKLVQQQHNILGGKRFSILNLKHDQQPKTVSKQKVVKVLNRFKKPSETSQIVNLKDLVKMTNLSSEQLARLQVSSKNYNTSNEGIEAVVIQMDESNEASAEPIHIVSSESMQRNEEESEPIIINTSFAEEDISDGDQSGVGDDEANTTCNDREEYIIPDSGPAKVINIVLSKRKEREGEGGDSETHVQSLIDALLDAAKDSREKAEASSS